MAIANTPGRVCCITCSIDIVAKHILKLIGTPGTIINLVFPIIQFDHPSDSADRNNIPIRIPMSVISNHNRVCLSCTSNCRICFQYESFIPKNPNLSGGKLKRVSLVYIIYKPLKA